METEKDFYWYKKSLDLEGYFEYTHFGEPCRYPCIVQDRIYGSVCLHEFTYYK